MSFDKAKCEQCPLKTHWEAEGCWDPVDFEPNGDILFLGEGPSKTDVELGRPFIDEAGVRVLEQLQREDLERHDVAWGHIVGCRWPHDEPQKFLARLRGINRKRKAKWLTPYMSPIEACSGHLR